jgi:hypothetical protein
VANVVMPANDGIQVRFRFRLKNRLDSGFRRNDENSNQLGVNELRILWLRGKTIQLFRHDCVQLLQSMSSRNIRRDLTMKHSKYLLPIPRCGLLIVNVAVGQRVAVFCAGVDCIAIAHGAGL